MPTNHQKTDQTYPLTPSWDPLEVPLDPLDPSTSPLTFLDPLAHLYCLANHQRTYQMSALTPWDPLHVCLDALDLLDIPLDSWDPRGVPLLHAPLDPQTKPDYQQTSWSLRLLHSLPLVLIQSIPNCPVSTSSRGPF